MAAKRRFSYAIVLSKHNAMDLSLPNRTHSPSPKFRTRLCWMYLSKLHNAAFQGLPCHHRLMLSIFPPDPGAAGAVPRLASRNRPLASRV